MQSNLKSVAERGQRVDDMQRKTEDLSNSAGQFRRNANRVRKAMWWKDMKMRMCIIGAIIAIILIAIIVPSKFVQIEAKYSILTTCQSSPARTSKSVGH